MIQPEEVADAGDDAYDPADDDTDTTFVESPVEPVAPAPLDGAAPAAAAPRRRVAAERAATCCGCACVVHTMLAFPLWLVAWFAVTNGRDGYDSATWTPGDHFRREYQETIVDALRSGSWDAVDRGLRRSENHAALIVGDRGGERHAARVGWIRPGRRLSIASGSKWIAALAVHRVAASGALSLEDKVSDYVPEWGDGAEPAKVSHLLSFTTGFSAMTYDKRSDVGCARPPNQPNWNDCVREIAAKPRTHAPGRSFLYGPWHLVVAGAVALRAAGRPLRRDAWIRTVREEVFEPSGIKAEPDYAGLYADAPWIMPWWGGASLRRFYFSRRTFSSRFLRRPLQRPGAGLPGPVRRAAHVRPPGREDSARAARGEAPRRATDGGLPPGPVRQRVQLPPGGVGLLRGPSGRRRRRIPLRAGRVARLRRGRARRGEGRRQFLGELPRREVPLPGVAAHPALLRLLGCGFPASSFAVL